MFDFDSSSVKGFSKDFIINMLATFTIFISGLLFAIVYYVMSVVQTALESATCVIDENIYFSTCQEMFSMVVYPLLNMKSIFIFANYFMIFGIVIGMFFLAFRSKKHPSLLVVHLILSTIIAYFSIEIANVYRLMLENEVLYNILVPFPIYNKIMLYFPQFIFSVIFISGIIGFMGVFRSEGQYKSGVEEEII